VRDERTPVRDEQTGQATAQLWLVQHNDDLMTQICHKIAKQITK